MGSVGQRYNSANNCSKNGLLQYKFTNPGIPVKEKKTTLHHKSLYKDSGSAPFFMDGCAKLLIWMWWLSTNLRTHRHQKENQSVSDRWWPRGGGGMYLSMKKWTTVILKGQGFGLRTFFHGWLRQAAHMDVMVVHQFKDPRSPTCRFWRLLTLWMQKAWTKPVQEYWNCWICPLVLPSMEKDGKLLTPETSIQQWYHSCT